MRFFHMNNKYLVVGCGFYGAVFARILSEFGKRVLLVDKRHHIGGNCYSEKINNIHVHKYGPHAFHTNSEKIWEFVNRFSEFNDFKLKVKVNYKNIFYSFPINLFTLNQIYGVCNQDEAIKILNKVRIRNRKDNFKNYVLRNVGRELYSIFYEGYTQKQWNLDPEFLPSLIAKRIPIRYDFNDYYFTDKYQGIPINGYTNLFENIIDHPNITVSLNTDFFINKKEFESDFKQIIYSGKIDELFNYEHGELNYRSLRFETFKSNKTYQGAPIINYTSLDVPYTRSVEYKYFDKYEKKNSVLVNEYPDTYDHSKIPFYPIQTKNNTKIYNKYKSIAEENNKYIIGGRLGRYTYLNMDQVIGMALKDAGELCQKK